MSHGKRTPPRAGSRKQRARGARAGAGEAQAVKEEPQTTTAERGPPHLEGDAARRGEDVSDVERERERDEEDAAEEYR